MNREYGANPPRPTIRNEGARLHVTRDRGEVHPLLSDIIGVELAWATDEAVCAQVDSDLFFSEPGEHDKVTKARELCLRCPLLEPCRAYAIPRKNLHGVWGATSPSEREALRRAA